LQTIIATCGDALVPARPLPHISRLPRRRSRRRIGLSAWEVCGAVRLSPADSV